MSFGNDRPPLVRGPRERIYDDVHGSGHGGREALLVFVLAASVLFLIAALSVRQVTAPARATNVLQAGIASTTEIDILLDENLPEMKRAASSANAETWALPGFPIDVLLTREEVLTLEQPEVRSLMLSRAGALVYDQGLQAFDTTGDQSIGLLSPQWAMDMFIGQLSSSNNSRANIAVLFFGAVAMVTSISLLLLSDAFSGFKRLGGAVAAGAAAGLVFTGAVWFIAGQVGGQDPFMVDLRDIIRTVLSAPLRNFLIGTLLGVFIFALGPVLGLIARRTGAEPADHGYEDYVPGPEEPSPRLGHDRPRVP
jgi:hypothetical protein